MELKPLEFYKYGQLGDEALPTPDSADLTEASAGTLYYTNIDGWYRDANFTGEAVDLTTFKPDANVDFYAKTSLKDGITMPRNR